MSISNLSALCEGICALACVPAPVLQPDAQGLLAFHLTLNETAISVLQWPLVDSGFALIVAELGDLPTESELDLLRGLLNANFVPPARHAPTFARNPANGQALLQLPFLLENATAASVHDAMQRVEQLASPWRRLASEAFSDTQSGQDIRPAGGLPAFA